jgi:dihydrofolate reductase
MQEPCVSLIVAVARNRVIGRNGQLPWHMPSDLAHFRRLTLGKPVIMGRRTFRSLRKPLDGRDNLIVSRDPDLARGLERLTAGPGFVIAAFTTLEDALAAARRLALERQASEIMIIGGAEIYRALLARAGRIYLSEIDAEPVGDAVFPEIDPAQWREVSREPLARGPSDDHSATLVTLDRL